MKTLLTAALLGICLCSYAIKPERRYHNTPEKMGMRYTEYQVLTPNNYSINVWEYHLSDSAHTGKTVILVGTDAGNMGWSVYTAWAFLQKGIRVISFDYRGFGSSADFEINPEFLFHHEFALDLDTVIKDVRNRFPADKVGLHAMSMGTYISLIKKEKTDFLIAEGFYCDPYAVVERIKVNRNREVLLPPDTQRIKRMKPSMPVLIFCASNDKTTTTNEARAFEKRNRVTIIEFTGEHLGGFMAFTKEMAGDEYLERIASFLASQKL